MKFVVKTLDGKNQLYDLDGSTKVSALKELVSKDLGIPPVNQRMILQGKVLKDNNSLSDYGPEGKTIHLVKNAPPSMQLDSKPPTIPDDMKPQSTCIDFMYVGADLPPLPPPEGVPHIIDVAKESAANALDNLKDKIPGSNYLVTVTMHTLTADGRPIHSATHTSTTHTALTDNALAQQEREEQAANFPQPLDKEAEEEIRRKKKEEEETRLRRLRLERYQERVREQQKRGREQTNILEIYQHMTSARRAIAGAENIVEGYFASEEYTEAKEMLEHTLKLKADALKREQLEKPIEKESTKTEEAMDEGNGATGGGGATEGSNTEKKEGPEYSVGEDGRPRQHILTDTGMLIPAGSALFVSLLHDVIALQKRGIKLQQFYSDKLENEERYESGDYKVNTALLTTIQRYHNAIGQACEALKKVQVTLDTEPPRIVSLTARPRPTTNPLLSLLNQPLSQLRDSDSEEETSGQQGTSGGGISGLGGLGGLSSLGGLGALSSLGGLGGGRSGGGDGTSVAGLFGSLLAARALGSLMQDDDSNSNTSGTERNPGTTTENGRQDEGNTGQGNTANNGGGDGGNGDDDANNMFLPDPVRMMAEIARDSSRRRAQEQEERTVVIEPNESFFQVISRIRQAVGGPEAEIMPPTMVGALIEMCFQKLTIVEVVTVFGGDPEPLNSLHGTFREFISKKLLAGQEATVDRIPEAIETFIRGIPPIINNLNPPLPLNPDINFAASVQKCSRHVLKEAMELIITTPDDDKEFGAKIYKWSETSGTLMTCVVRESLLSENDLSPSMKRLGKLLFPDNNTPGVVSMLNSHSLVDKFIEDSETCNFTAEHISSFIVEEQENEMDTEQQQQQQQQQQQESTATTTVSGENIPASMPKEWSSTINNDIEEMKKTRIQPPLSTAYLDVGPTKKRKQLESGKAEPVHISDILAGTLQSSIESLDAKPTSNTSVDDIVKEVKNNDGLVKRLGDEIQSLTRTRLEEDPDYSADKYPSAQKHFQPNK